MSQQPARRHRRSDDELRQQRKELERLWNLDVVERVRAEYLEMPGLRLTREQVQRLCGVERTICQRVLDALVETRFLCVKADGVYARLTEGADMEPPHPRRQTSEPESVP